MIHQAFITNPLVIAAIAVALYAGKGLLAETTARSSKRLADWLLPDALPGTYRIGKLLLAAAWKIGPAFSIRAPDGNLAERRLHLSQGIQYFAVPVMHRSAIDWSDLLGARAELEVDEAAETSISSPIRLVLPLVTRAARHRVLNGFARLEYGAWWFFVGSPYCFLLSSVYIWTDILSVLRRRVRGLPRILR
jgi:hypothetical protein